MNIDIWIEILNDWLVIIIGEINGGSNFYAHDDDMINDDKNNDVVSLADLSC